VQRVVREQAAQDRLYAKIQAMESNVRFIRLRTLYCDPAKLHCGMWAGKVPIFIDANHLTPEASVIGAAKMREVIKEILLQQQLEEVKAPLRDQA
jgi:hypothetical protein